MLLVDLHQGGGAPRTLFSLPGWETLLSEPPEGLEVPLGPVDGEGPPVGLPAAAHLLWWEELGEERRQAQVSVLSRWGGVRCVQGDQVILNLSLRPGR